MRIICITLLRIHTRHSLCLQSRVSWTYTVPVHRANLDFGLLLLLVVMMLMLLCTVCYAVGLGVSVFLKRRRFF